MIFDLAAKKLISYDSHKSSENLRGSFEAFIRGLISFPLNIPGTSYHKCLQVYTGQNPLDDIRYKFVWLCEMHLDLGFFTNLVIKQGRKKAMKMLKDMLQERRERPRKTQTDFFDYVLEELQRKETVLTEAIALDLMFVLLFASFETTSLALTLAIKFLVEHPRVLKELTVSERKGNTVTQILTRQTVYSRDQLLLQLLLFF